MTDRENPQAFPADFFNEVNNFALRVCTPIYWHDRRLPFPKEVHGGSCASGNICSAMATRAPAGRRAVSLAGFPEVLRITHPDRSQDETEFNAYGGLSAIQNFSEQDILLSTTRSASGT